MVVYPMRFRFAKWACDRLTEVTDFAKKIIFLDEAHLGHLGHTKPARIHWKADTPITSHCLVGILVQRHNWAIFLRKWARSGRHSQWRSLSDHVERVFVHNWRGEYWQNLVSTGWRYVPHSRSYTRFFYSIFKKKRSYLADPILF